MKLFALELIQKKSAGLTVYIPRPGAVAPVTVGAAGADIELPDAEGTVITVAPVDEGLEIVRRRGSPSLNGTGIHEVTIMKPGGALAVGKHVFHLEEDGHLMLMETDGTTGPGEKRRTALASGMETIGMYLKLDASETPVQVLDTVRRQLHLRGLELIHRPGDGKASKEYLSGEPFPCDTGAATAAAGTGFIYLSSSKDLSVAAVGHGDGGSPCTILTGWTDRWASAGYAANLHNHLPALLCSLAVAWTMEGLAENILAVMRTWTSMLATSACDIVNGLFGPVYGYAQLAEDDRAYTDKLVNNVLSGTREAHEYIETVSRFSTRHSMGRKRISVPVAAREVADFVSVEAFRSGKRFIFEAEGENLFISADPAALYQILAVMMLGALSEPGCGEELTVRMNSTGNRVEIRILLKKAPPELCGRDGDFRETAVREGTAGVYAALCRRIAASLEGEYKRAKNAGGAEHVLELKATAGEDAATLDRLGITERQETKAGILALDEDRECHMLLAYALRPEPVDCAVSAEEALEMFAEKRYRAIMIGVSPGNQEKAHKVYEHVRKNYPGTRIIACMLGKMENGESGRFDEAAAILNRPFDIALLRAVVTMER
ncbi:MAG: hypothetical protein JW909_01270 [Planctomycetes bacterium]|nr:hypothetical protein [Planctomycetota bacterium]